MASSNVVYILKALFLFQWANLVAQTMSKTISCENVKKNIVLISCSEEGDDQNEGTSLLMKGHVILFL